MDILVLNHQKYVYMYLKNEIKSRNWSHEIGMQSLRMRRVLDMNPDTLPGKVYTELFNSTAPKRRKYKTALHKSGKTIDCVPQSEQLLFQFCTLKRKKEMNKSIWKILNSEDKIRKRNEMEEA